MYSVEILNDKTSWRSNYDHKHRKLGSNYVFESYVVISEKLELIIRCNFYYSTRSVSTYCCIWLRDGMGLELIGSGVARGYGYAGASLSITLDRMNIKHTLNSTGLIEETLKSLARKLVGDNIKFTIVKFEP